MSNFRAIAGVSSSLRNLLRDRMENVTPVTIAPPDVTVTGVTGRRVNLYLYQVTENGYLKNQEIPGRGDPSGYGHPPLSLDLHYLLTAYGETATAADADLQAQQTMGDAMRVLHDFAIITPSLHEADDTTKPLILDSSLLGEFEQIKITLQPMTLEDFSKIWMALPQANFRRSAVYQVSVVQIESRLPRRVSRLVAKRRIHVATLRRPEITAAYRTPLVATDPLGDPRVGVQQQITLEGLNFNAPKVWVKLGSLEPIQLPPVSNNKIQMTVPDDQYPIDADHPAVRPIPAAEQLQPGPQLVKALSVKATEFVEGGLDKGKLFDGQSVQSSNQAVFMLVPLITFSTANGTINDILKIDGKRLFKDGMISYVLVGDVVIEVRKPVAGETFLAPTPTHVEVPLLSLQSAMPPLTPGAYSVRILVNGALSTEERTFTLT
jgi:hypothetical protein